MASAQKPGKCLLDVAITGADSFLASDHHYVPTRLSGRQSCRLSQHPPHPVSPMGLAYLFADNKPEPAQIQTIGHCPQDHEIAGPGVSMSKDCCKLRTPGKPLRLSHPYRLAPAYTVNRCRPLSRLRLKTARPARVLILARKPCLRFRGILFG